HPTVALVVLGAPTIGDLDIDGAWIHPCEKAFDVAYRRLADRAIEVLGARGAAVVIATAPYVDQHEDYRTNRDRTDCVNAVLRGAAAASPYAETIELAEHVCPTRLCFDRQGGVLLRPDGLHYGEGA